MTDMVSAESVILQVVRGMRPLAALHPIGISLRFVDNKLLISNPSQVEARIRINDIAAGIVALQSSPEELRTWARALESWAFVTLLERNDTVEEELVLGALWDASFGTSISDQDMNLITSLASV